MISTANYRGHIAIWEIIENKLFLKEIKVRDSIFSPKECNVKSKNENFNHEDVVFADWFSGMISCGYNNESYYFHIKYGELVKDTFNDKLMSQNFASVLNKNYIAYYFRLSIEDDISIDNKKSRFRNKIGYSPLLEYYSNDHLQWPYNWENLEKTGAPHCSWNVVDNKIYLDNIELYSGLGFYEIDKDSISLESIFSNISNNKVFANWLNGIYIITHGTEKEGSNIFGRKEFVPSEYVYLRIKNGEIIESYNFPYSFSHLRFLPDDNDIDSGLKQILNELK